MSTELLGLSANRIDEISGLQCQKLLTDNQRFQEIMLRYRAALSTLETKLRILNEEFSVRHDRNPMRASKHE